MAIPVFCDHRRWAPVWALALGVYLIGVGAANAWPGAASPLSAPRPALQDDTAPVFATEQLTFFEERIRPLLSAHCYECHSHEAERVQGGIYLDSRAGVIDSFAAEPGDAENSLMIEAVHYADPTMQMPPDGKLTDAQIADLERWVEMGLPWPEESGPTVEAFDLAARRAAHWCWQAPVAHELLDVRDAGWVRNDIDRFILAELEEAGLTPSAEADRVTLIRRLTFDLIGLPPTPAEIDAFVADESPEAYEKLVDRLLASPQFGEKWGRHWLDLVRYAETLGHEFDFNIPDAWQYRDYVIRAFNDDVPYDRLLFEHVAGDLVDAPRIDGETGVNASVQGTGWYWLGEQTHAPVDVRGHQADLIANQIDVIGRAFQGVTIACARCHDHKFDAISTEDYYALHGVMQSSRLIGAPTRDTATLRGDAEALQREHDELTRTVRERIDADRTAFAGYMVTASEVFRQTRGIEDGNARNARIGVLCGELAERDGIDSELLRRWVDVTYQHTHRDWQHPLHGWGITNHSKPEDAQRWWAERPVDAERRFADGGALRDSDVVLYDAAERDDATAHGLAFGEPSYVTPGTFMPATGRGHGLGSIAVFPARSSAALADRWQGVLQTGVHPVEHAYVHVLAQGSGARVNFILDGFHLFRGPIYNQTKQGLHEAYPRWYTFHYDKWMDGSHTHSVEVSDLTTVDPGSGGSPADAHGTLYRVIASNEGAPPPPAFALYAELHPADGASVGDVAAAFERQARAALASWLSGAEPATPADRANLALLSYLLDGGLMVLADHDGERINATRLAAGYREAARQVPVPPMVLATADGPPMDSAIYIRGSHHVEGDTAQRRYLEAIVGDAQSPEQGSGRLELARAITDPDNPLTARVAVNRLWHHLFGKGIVASVDNLGVLGSPPTHPELLDHLALAFMQSDGWSTKAMIKRIVMSATYRQQSDRRDSVVEDVDPENLLLHRQNLRRLTAESIRDAVLHTSGRLDRRMYGGSVMVHLTSFMEGRGRPGHSGPLDGAGRRSIYISTRRNFLSPMMLVFDAPAPFSTVGRRNVTNVPAQALILMNDPFVHQQAEVWSRALVQDGSPTAGERIVRMWWHALGRAPEPAEEDAALAYVVARASDYGLDASALMTDPRPWQDLCHAVFNTKSFIYIR